MGANCMPIGNLSQVSALVIFAHLFAHFRRAKMGFLWALSMGENWPTLETRTLLWPGAQGHSLSVSDLKIAVKLVDLTR